MKDFTDPKEALYCTPRPLVSQSENFGVIWSAKSACTTATLWFLSRTGHLKAACAYSRWPHYYRTRVLFPSAEYKRSLDACNPHSLRWVRIIRDPFRRAVSSYRHAIRHGYEDKKIARILGLPVTERGFSFTEFLDYLLAINIERCNMHHRQQFHPLEAMVRVQCVVNADKEDLPAALVNFERETGMLALSAEATQELAAEISRISAKHHAVRFKPKGDCSDTVYSRKDTFVPWPDYSAFLNVATRRRVEKIYLKDFESFGKYF